MRPRPEQGGRPQPGPVHRLRAAQPGHGTVHLVHPGALAAEVHRNLADALPDGDGLTVLDLSGLPAYFEAALTGGRADTTVQALAERLVAELELAPGDTLVGWSFGGVVAQAMVELLPADRRPRELVLLDSIAPTEGYQQPDEALDAPLLLGWFGMYLGAKRGRPVPLDPARLAGCGTEDGLLLVLDAAVAAGALLPDTSLPGLRKLYETYVDGLLRNNRLTAPYRPVPASVPLVLVTAERSLLPGDRTLGWQPLARHGLTVHSCPGDHYTMLTRPDAAALIAELVRPDRRPQR
ncbi:thioesterase [Streptomyces tateyamensis]|uniref:Thioesterase n=1 Tax=Streptomyces tateyamensis TaxID=565073 RepID=A0A2V4N2D4_9ACTN|nr:thioesterase domain-containing protein [Streptomyces tateyamensis]PYC77996.1 thioesterase [Streptomyces tateyamensis]